MILNRLFDFLCDLTVKLAFPLRVVALSFLANSILEILPFLQLKTVKPQLMLEQVYVLGLNYSGNFFLADSAFKIRQVAF